MILVKNVTIRINNSNYNYYKELGYDVKLNETIKVDIKDISRGSHIKISVICDVCGIKKEIKYNSLYKNNYINYYMCVKCKRKEVLNNRYGVDNVFQLTDVKNKIKKTNLEKWGVEYISQSDAIKEKIKNTNLNKYDVDHHLKNDNIKEKIKTTCLTKYGVDNVSKIEEIKKKKETTCYKNFGVKCISQKNSFKDIMNKKNIEKLRIKYDIDLVGTDDTNFFINCEICKKLFEINKKSFYTRYNIKTTICTICNPINSFSKSGFEIQLVNFIKKYYNDDIILNSRKIIYPYELDIYLPDLKLAFEFNGVYWHNENGVSKNYHMIKTEYCEQEGIQLIHIYEDDWVHKQDIVKSKILNHLNKLENEYDKNFIINDVDSKLSRKFLDENHIQGFVRSKYNIGLYYEDELISLMSFNKIPKTINNYNMVRFCSKLGYSIGGGYNEMFKYFIKTYDPKEIIVYVDRGWSNGVIYEQLGFKFINKTPPNYFYVINGLRHNRFNYRKDKLVREGYDKNKTEHEIMLERNIYRIYDSGNLKFIWKNI